ncbi:THO complex subunit 1-like [Teleopsis dalmanni]|uniref:THO complex subunit 1-like n=1 Tax=Teleopsis dalmanni TaxID=139649 RepID=UPI0018CCD6A9|nr:THO complex subunit 1-like [Teleopsis dalmanni]
MSCTCKCWHGLKAPNLTTGTGTARSNTAPYVINKNNLNPKPPCAECKQKPEQQQSMTCMSALTGNHSGNCLSAHCTATATPAATPFMAVPAITVPPPAQTTQPQIVLGGMTANTMNSTFYPTFGNTAQNNNSMYFIPFAYPNIVPMATPMPSPMLSANTQQNSIQGCPHTNALNHSRTSGPTTTAISNRRHNVNSESTTKRYVPPLKATVAAAISEHQKHTNTVLDAFDGFKLDCGLKRRKTDTEKKVDDKAQSTSKSTMKNNRQDEDNENIFKSDIFFAKYLTNPKLLALQLSDSKFRRATLVQFLILFQYLQSKVKFKTDSSVLTSSQELYIETTQTRVYKLIEETPPNGNQFLRTVQHILNREEIWNKWKNEGCKEIRKPDDVQNNTKGKEEPQEDNATTSGSGAVVNDSNVKEESSDESFIKQIQPHTRKRLLGDILRESYNSNRYYLGHPLLTELWNLAPDNLSACKSEDRNFLPEFEVYLNNKNDRSDSSSWRALRLLARQSPHFFTTFNSSSSYKIPDYLENMRRRIIREKLENAKPATSATVTNGQVSSNGSTLENETMTLTDAEQEAEPELGADEDIEKNEDDRNAHSKPLVATHEQIEEIAPLIGDDWKKLGKKLGYTPDELEFFETEHTEPNTACVTMLVNWFADDDDATLDNWAYMMEGLEINEAATAVKAMIERLSTKSSKTDVEVISD